MLIKIDKDRYFNSDHVVLIEPAPDHSQTPGARVLLSTGDRITVPYSIVAYITQTLDANDAYTEDTPAPLSLESGIAQYLRNQVAGATFSDLVIEFSDRIAIGVDVLEAIRVALQNLLSTNTIRATGDGEFQQFYHASNPAVSGALDQW